MIIGGLVVCLAVGYLAYFSLQGSDAYYLKVSEIEQLGSSCYKLEQRVTLAEGE